MELQSQINTFTNGMNLDFSVSSIPKNQYRYGKNIRLLTNDDGSTTSLTAAEYIRSYFISDEIRGNLRLTFVLISLQIIILLPPMLPICMPWLCLIVISSPFNSPTQLIEPLISTISAWASAPTEILPEAASLLHFSEPPILALPDIVAFSSMVKFPLHDINPDTVKFPDIMLLPKDA